MKRVAALLAVSLALASGVPHVTHHHRGCASNEKFENDLARDPQFALNVGKIEMQTQRFVDRRKAIKQSLGRSLLQTATDPVITIPVYFHVGYGNSGGVENLASHQLQSQVDRLNIDFGNADGGDNDVSTTVFNRYPATAFSIAFTWNEAHINRYEIPKGKAKKRGYDPNDAMKVDSPPSASFPTTEYLHIWVVPMSGGILGYAQFPGGPAQYDGVVLASIATGDITSPLCANGACAFGTTVYNRGRTATHEVGHWLNLRHIWGDGGSSCSPSDFVDDTPSHYTANYGSGGNCPSDNVDSCAATTGFDNWNNYMDYVYDKCMNMFTAGQVSRGRALFDATGCDSNQATCSSNNPIYPCCGWRSSFA